VQLAHSKAETSVSVIDILLAPRTRSFRGKSVKSLALTLSYAHD
jgi:hypothetical protein